MGILLLVFLFTGRLLTDQNQPDIPDQKPVPKYERLENVWVIEIGEENVLLYRNGIEESYDLGATGDGSLYQPDWGDREQVADVLLADGQVIGLVPVTDKLHGVILGADENGIEVQGYGKLPLAVNYKGYRIYNTLSMCTYRDLAFGYDFADLVMKDGEVCGILMVREETMEDIRVLIKTNDFADRLHQKLVFTCDSDFEIRYGGAEAVTEQFPAGREITVEAGSDYLTQGRMVIEPQALTGKVILKNIKRSQGIPEYRGRVELIPEDDGFAVVNELLLEDYLYSVVPSEMPASYGMEALKAQAVCARTYAYGHMQHAAYPAYGAHVDDSTAFQVYNNIVEQSSTTQAVKETHGSLLYTGAGELAGTYYYSTSCGVGTDTAIWKAGETDAYRYLQAKVIREERHIGADVADGDTVPEQETEEQEAEEQKEEEQKAEEQKAEEQETEEQEAEEVEAEEVETGGVGRYLQDESHFNAFITHVNEADFEAEEGWYRWTYEVPEISTAKMAQTLKKRYQVKPELVLTKDKSGFIAKEPGAFSKIKSMEIVARGKGGVVDELILETDKGTYKVISEYNIRAVLCDGEAEAVLQDGRRVVLPGLLPSGFFVLSTKTGKSGENVVGYTLTGGGYGHGVGMSQNAAKHMAALGYHYEQILLFFYTDCVLNKVY